MDPFTQRMLDRAEQRSKTFGISGGAANSKFPLAESNSEVTPKSPAKSPRKSARSASIKHHVSSSPRKPGGSKENCDVAFEINITTKPNVQVQVEVEEHDIDADGNIMKQNDEVPVLRDTSRNRLQRLGALYSETVDLSSPIHRTENQFQTDDAGDTNSRRRRAPQKCNKLAELADQISSWEDDTSHPDYKHTTTREAPDSGSKKQENVSKKRESGNKKQDANEKPRKAAGTEKRPVYKEVKQFASADNHPASKKMNWDSKMMDSLESQGFQRRQSTENKLVYDYKNQQSKDLQNRSQPQQRQEQLTDRSNTKKPLPSSSSSSEPPSSNEKQAMQPKKLTQTEQSKPSGGIVSQRAARFEPVSSSISSSSSNTHSVASPRKTKDPAEMSLKERMALFEKNKGTAPIPKVPFGMSISTKQLQEVKQTLTNQPKYAAACETKQQEKRQVEKNVIPINKNPPTIENKQIQQQKPKSTYQALQMEKNQFEAIPPVEKKTIETSKPVTGLGIRNTLQALMANSATISEAQISQNVRNQRKQEMDILLNRHQHNNTQEESSSGESGPTMPPPPAPPMPPSLHNTPTRDGHPHKRRSDEKRQEAEHHEKTKDDTKRVRIDPTKSGRLYPVLSDIETTESDETSATASAKSYLMNRFIAERDYTEEDEEYSYMDSEDSTTDLCREVMKDFNGDNNPMRPQASRMEHKAVTFNSKETRYDASSYTSDEQLLDQPDVDDYLNQALTETDNSQDEDTEIQSSDDEQTAQFKEPQVLSPQRNKYFKTIAEDVEETDDQTSERDYNTPVKSKLTVNPSEDDNMVTLVHTVSFYRRQQSANTTPVHKNLNRHEEATPHLNESDDSIDELMEDTRMVQEKVKRLLDEVCKQQQIISQTSQALNLCAATVEFSGSAESVEGERHLLVATHRRQAALDEVQRLRVEGSLRPHGSPKERGRLVVKDITLPLAEEYRKRLAADQISGHHLVCLLKYNETVLATGIIMTLPGLNAVQFADVMQLNDVYADFKVTLEIYGMTAQREVLTHEVKYHINVGGKKHAGRTPKGKKGSESLLVMPPKQSPAGPNAVRSPALIRYGMVIFSLREIQRTSWTLHQMSGIGPLSGCVQMRINCELSVTVDHKGFLTMYEDLSGFGAWHRRWCRLHGHLLSYWKYPDDEKKKAPIGSIDLTRCCTEKVRVAPRDVCARLNTLLMEFRRPAEEDDVDSLIVVRQGRYTLERNLLSADTKEQRDEWCATLNKALMLLRAWNASSGNGSTLGR